MAKKSELQDKLNAIEAILNGWAVIYNVELVSGLTKPAKGAPKMYFGGRSIARAEVTIDLSEYTAKIPLKALKK